MKNLALDRLRGSLLRCLLLTGQPPHHTTELLINLIRLPNVVISSLDHWIPRGLRDYKETTLVDSSYFLPPDKCKVLTEWWLEKPRGARLPNWDIASTCTIEGIRALLLVEAKAHDKELSEAGKSRPTTSNSQVNHKHIGLAIDQANLGLDGVLKGWALSRDSHYQLSNRFAWAWKLATFYYAVFTIRDKLLRHFLGKLVDSFPPSVVHGHHQTRPYLFHLFNCYANDLFKQPPAEMKTKASILALMD
jgi:hypothetical protein